jgi:disulfide bond formation protein DsbB
VERFHQDDHRHVLSVALWPFFPGGVLSMPGWLSLLCGVLVLVAAAYLVYAVLRPEAF